MSQEKITEKEAALEAMIRKEYANIAGIVVRKNGSQVYGKYFNDCTAASHLHVFSVTKSILSLLFGIAIDKGYIKSVHQQVLDFFPDYQLKRGEKTLPEITIQNMLTMTVPYKYKSAPYTKYFTSTDWVRASLDLAGGKGKIGEFRSAPLIGPDILSGILVKATGRTVLDFATENLFAPLGITVKKSIIFADKDEQMAFYKAKDISGWVADPMKVNTAGWGLTLTTEDMAKIGQLYANDGVWDGMRLISSEWLAESSAAHSRWEEMNLSYGYLWWIIDPEERIYAAMGDGGNTIYVNSKANLVVAVASLFVPRVKDRIELIQEYVEPIFTE